MKKWNLGTALIVTDSDLNCRTESGLDRVTIGTLGFIPADLDRFELIIYQGTRGTKILKSTETGTGPVG